MKKKCQIFSFWARPDLGTSRMFDLYMLTRRINKHQTQM